MQQFTIRDIENLTGIKAHTLRIWEQRYNLVKPKRKQSLHRFYDNDDLKAVLHIAFLYHLGWKISKIAALTADERKAELQRAAVGENQPVMILQLIEAAADFNEGAFKSILQSVIDNIGFERTMVEVCYPFLNRVGHLWSTNNVIPAQEHFSSYLIQNRVLLETDLLPAEGARPPEILLASPRGEFHELPLLFMNYLLRKHGWGTFYMGSNMKLDELRAVLGLHSIHTLYMHLLTNFTGFEVDDYLEELCKAFPGHQVVASGAGVQLSQRKFINLTVLRSDEEIYAFVKRNAISEARSF